MEARDAEPGKIYRLTRDPGQYYYVVCQPSAVSRIEKRLRAKPVQTMSPEERFALQAIERVRSQGHVLAQRVLRYRGQDDATREVKAYVAFPPDYALREVERPPGYGPRRGAKRTDATNADEKENAADVQAPE
jgi:hypothetical protein